MAPQVRAGNYGAYLGPAFDAAGNAMNLANPNRDDFQKGLDAARLGGDVLSAGGRYFRDPTVSTFGGSLATGANLASTGFTLADPNASAASKGFAAAGAVTQGADYLASQGVNTPLAGLGPYVKAAGFGYDLAKIASDENLSNKQKVGHSIGSAGHLAGLLSPIGGYYALGLLARGVNQAAAGSKSPQVSGAAKGASAIATPVEGFMDVMQGDTSPRAAFKHMGQTFSANPARAIMGLDPVSGSIFGALGIGNHKPTEGTVFKHQLQGMFQRAGIKGITNWNGSDFTTDMYNAYPDVATRDAATRLGNAFAAKSKKPVDYGIQTQNILLQNLSPTQIQELAKKYGL